MELSAEQQQALQEQKQHCPFCKIVKGEIPATKVYEDNEFLAILDINPAVPGHTILLPKEHYMILPLVPAPVLSKLGNLTAELSAALRKALVSPSLEVFIANGAAAGQQVSHFMIHLIPAEDRLFTLPGGETPQSKQIEQLMRAQYGVSSKDLLSKAIAENPELRQMIIEHPEELIKNLSSAPDLAKLFQGVDIKVLSQKLREQDNPVAAHLSDKELVAFINGKDKLRTLLINEPATLENAAEHQDKLKAFFSGSTVAQVRERYLRGGGHV